MPEAHPRRSSAASAPIETFAPTISGYANAEMAWDQRKDPDSTIRGYRINVIDTARECKASSEDLLKALNAFEKRLRSLMRRDQR